MCHRIQVFVVVLIGLLAGAAHATVRPADYRLNVVGQPVPVEAGDLVNLRFEIVPEEGRSISNVRLTSSSGWTGAQVQATATKGSVDRAIVYDLAAVATDPSLPLELAVDVDGVEHLERFDFTRLSRESGELVPATQIPLTTIGASKMSDLPRPEPRAPLPAGARRIDRSREGDASKDTRSIRVHGRVTYIRGDGTPMGADGMTVQVYDEDTLFDTLLMEQATDANGNFDMTFSWNDGDWFDSQPDIFVRVAASNSEFSVDDGGIFASNYDWETGVRADFTGTEIDFTTITPTRFSEHGALNALTTLTRAWRFLMAEGFDTPHVDVSWPDSDGVSFYNGSLHLSDGTANGNDGTIVHEYGHHFVNHFGDSVSPAYCNGICDNDGCGHCMFCPETADTAWSEGFVQFMGHYIPNTFSTTYGVDPISPKAVETMFTCPPIGGLADPLMTEGMFGGFVVDMVDTDQDNDFAFSSTWQDRSSIALADIFAVCTQNKPTQAFEFVTDLLVRMRSTSTAYTAQDVEDMWETARNNGYEVDQFAPNLPPTIGSSTHTLSVSSPNNVPQFWWTTPFDDASGIDGYAVSITPFPSNPGVTRNVGDVNVYTAPSPLSPGSYYFNIRPLDRSGKWSASYTSFGPVVLDTPDPADFTWTHPEFWAGPVTPLNNSSATTGHVPFPTVLWGDATATYANYAFVNANISTVNVSDFNISVYVDGENELSNRVDGLVTAWESFYAVNQGPVYVNAGRHVFSGKADSATEVAEDDETNNFFGRQWAWQPTTINPDVTYIRGAANDRLGGWDQLSAGPWLLTLNMNGHRFTSSGWWNAAVLWANDDTADHDLYLYNASDDPETAFTGSQGFSGRNEGLIDAVFVNRNVEGSVEWDLGVVNQNTTSSGYRLHQTTSTSIDYESDLTLSMSGDTSLALREIWVGADDLGPFTARIEIDPSEGPFTLLLLDQSFGRGDIFDYAAAAITDESGVASIDRDIGTTGFYCLVVYRDPTSGASKKAVTIDMTTGTTPPNFRPMAEAAGWAAPLVPRAANDGTPSSVPQPTELLGDQASTYLNVAVINDSPTTATGMGAHIDLDGVFSWWLSWGNFPGGAASLFNWSAPWTVRGGRHVLSLHTDVDDAIVESDETDNTYAEQWVWRPPVQAKGLAVSRSAPPERLGGLEDIEFVTTVTSGSGEEDIVTITPEFYYNCDGIRTPIFSSPDGSDGYWGAVAVMSNSKSDADVQLHEISSGAKNGFSLELASSSWGEAQSDYVMANFNETAFRAFDAGVLRGTSAGLESYDVQVVSSKFLADTPSGSYGDFSLPAGHMLDLHEMYLPVGNYIIQLENLDEEVDYGLTLHAPLDEAGQPYQAKSDAHTERGAAWLETAGRDEWMTVQISQEDYYCLAVWKATRADLAQNGSYRLNIQAGITAVEDTPAAVPTALGAVYPNPFNPRTTVAFDLAVDGDVTVDVYDVRGQRVRTLVSGRLTAGRHEVVWNGVDDRRRPLASGIYFVRFAADGVRQTRKVTLMK